MAGWQLIFQRYLEGCVMAVMDTQPSKVPGGGGFLTLPEASICQITSHRALELQEVRDFGDPLKVVFCFTTCSSSYWNGSLWHLWDRKSQSQYAPVFIIHSEVEAARPHPQGCFTSPLPLGILLNPIDWIRTPTTTGLIGWWLGKSPHSPNWSLAYSEAIRAPTISFCLNQLKEEGQQWWGGAEGKTSMAAVHWLKTMTLQCLRSTQSHIPESKIIISDAISFNLGN